MGGNEDEGEAREGGESRVRVMVWSGTGPEVGTGRIRM